MLVFFWQFYFTYLTFGTAMSYITEFFVIKIVKYLLSALSDEEKTAIKGQLLLTFNEPVSQVMLALSCLTCACNFSVRLTDRLISTVSYGFPRLLLSWLC